MTTPHEDIDYKRNISVFKDLIINLVDETIASCPAEMRIKNINVKKTFTSSIDKYWEKKSIDKRIQKLINKENSSQSKAPAWRPSTGAVNIKPLQIYELKKEQKLFEKNLTNCKTHVNDLMYRITQMTNEIDKVSEQRIKILNDIYSTY